jgi:hypothetical protein
MVPYNTKIDDLPLFVVSHPCTRSNSLTGRRPISFKDETAGEMGEIAPRERGRLVTRTTSVTAASLIGLSQSGGPVACLVLLETEPERSWVVRVHFTGRSRLVLNSPAKTKEMT